MADKKKRPIASPSKGRAVKAGNDGYAANERLVDKLFESRVLQGRGDGNNLKERDKLVPPLGTKARKEHDKNPDAGKKAIYRAKGGTVRRGDKRKRK